jgi:threonine aldolase
VGPRDLIARARRHRKILGGGMRQAGVLAAAGIYALDRNVTRLGEDHRRAERLAAALTGFGAGAVRQATNMVFFTPAAGGPQGIAAAMEARGIRIGGQVPEIRMVVHKDVDDTALQAAIDAFGDVLDTAGGAAA